MFYQVDMQMNNLQWITKAFFERKGDATKYVNCKKKEDLKINCNYSYKVIERKFSKIRDFNFKKS